MSVTRTISIATALVVVVALIAIGTAHATVVSGDAAVYGLSIPNIPS